MNNSQGHTDWWIYCRDQRGIPEYQIFKFILVMYILKLLHMQLSYDNFDDPYSKLYAWQ